MKSIRRFKGKTDSKLECLRPEKVGSIFSWPDTAIRNGRRNQYYMIHAYETGGRIEELVNMRLEDIIRNGASVQIRLHGKGNKTRYNPLPTFWMRISWCDSLAGILLTGAGGAIFTGTIACCSMTFPAASSLSSACQRMKLEYAIPFSEHHSRLVFPL